MLRRKLAYEVVPESEHTDFSGREEKSSVSNAALVTAATAASIATYAVTKFRNPTIDPTTIPTQTIPPPALTAEPINVLSDPASIPVDFTAAPEVIQTGIIADTTLDILTTALDPVVQILAAISFPVASVVMMGACFFFMFGNSERAWNTIMNAGLGYVLIQMFPLFLRILKDVGNAMPS